MNVDTVLILNGQPNRDFLVEVLYRQCLLVPCVGVQFAGTVHPWRFWQSLGSSFPQSHQPWWGSNLAFQNDSKTSRQSEFLFRVLFVWWLCLSGEQKIATRSVHCWRSTKPLSRSHVWNSARPTCPWREDPFLLVKYATGQNIQGSFIPPHPLLALSDSLSNSNRLQ